jgi:hypothetical protein
MTYVKKKPQPELPTPENLRLERKKKFLEAMAQINIISTSCQAAGFTRATFYEWCRDGYLTKAELDAAYEDFRDNIRAMIYQRSMTGIQRQLFQNGKPIKDERGNPVMATTHDNKLLLAMAQKHLPEMKEENHVDVHIQNGGAYNGIPEADIIVFDSKLLLPDEFKVLHGIALAMKDRMTGTVEGAIVPMVMVETQL